MTPQEQIKMLRQRLEFARGCYTAMGGCTPSALDSIDEALAATAPPKHYSLNFSGDSIKCGTGEIVARFTTATTTSEIAAVLDALNALHDMEAPSV